MSEISKLSDLVTALEKRVVALEKDAAVQEIKEEAQQDFIKEIKGYIKKFYTTVTLSFIAIILWIAKSVIEKVGLW